MRFVNVPDWFLGKDVGIEVFSFLVLLAFFILAYRYYKLSKKKNFLYLGLGFLMIAVAQLANIMTRLVLYSDTTVIQNIGQMVVTYHIVKSVDVFYHLGFFFYKLLTLAGLFVIYRLPFRKGTGQDTLIISYFILLVSIIGILSDNVFHLTALVFLVLIAFSYYKIYRKTNNTNTCLIISAFAVLILGHLFYIISSPAYDVIANLIELVSYLILLFLIIRILRQGKK